MQADRTRARCLVSLSLLAVIATTGGCRHRVHSTDRHLPPASRATARATETQLRQLQVEWQRAYVLADSSQLEQVLGPTMQVIRSSGVVLPRAEILTYYRQRDTSRFRFATTDQHIQQLGDGYAILTAHFAETYDGAPEAYRVTDVFARRGTGDGTGSPTADVWQLEHSQWTRLPGEWRPAAVDAASLEPLVGRYINDAGALYRVELEGDGGVGGIRITFPSGQWRTFSAHSRDVFFRPHQADEWVFVRASGTAVPTHVVRVTQSDRTVLRRLP